MIGKEEAFFFRPYFYTLKGITKAQLIGELNEEINLVPQEACRLWPWLCWISWLIPRSLANWSHGRISQSTTLRGCSASSHITRSGFELLYLSRSHWWLRIYFFGTWWLQILTRVEKLFYPGLARARVIPPKGVVFWQKCEGALEALLGISKDLCWR